MNLLLVLVSLSRISCQGATLTGIQNQLLLKSLLSDLVVVKRSSMAAI